jgi:hypothetical protein
MAFRDKVEALFRTHPITLIDFSVDQLEVSPTTMKKLAASIKDGTIGIEIKQTGSKLSAAYSRKRIILPRESEADYPEGRAAIVHEGVHAWADLSSFKSGVLDECAGYLTEVVYLTLLKRKISGHPIYDAANALAASWKLAGKRGQKLTRADCQSLSDAIMADSAYQGLSH